MNSVCIFVQICIECELSSSKSNVRKVWRERLNDFVANFILFPAVKKLLKSIKIHKVIVKDRQQPFSETV